MQTKRTAENEPIASTLSDQPPTGESTFLAAWRAHLQALGKPWLTHSRDLMQRFTRTYDHLRQQPRHIRRRVQRQWGASLAGAALALALLNAPVYAANITADGTTCTLVDAITAANTDAVVSGSNCTAGSSDDIITLTNDVTLITSAVYAYSSDIGLPPITTTLTIEGNNHTILRDASAPAFRLIAVGAGGNLTLHRTTLSGGDTANNGGAIINLGTVTVNNSTLSGNTATGNGGAIVNGGTVTVNNSTLSGNTATNNGAAIYNYTTLTLSNSTLSGNAASYSGGAIANYHAGTVTLSNSTLSANSAVHSGGAINNLGGTLTMDRSLISGNTAPTGAEVYTSSGTLTSNTNLLGDSSHTTAAALANFTPDASDITATSNGTHPTALAAILNPLTNNGDTSSAGSGQVRLTHALVTGSPAIDAAGDSGLDTDQRGVTRPQGTADDIGAFEALPANVAFNGNNCNLGDAIVAANEDRIRGACKPGLDGADTITLLGDIALLTTNTTNNYLSLPPISSTITIEGAGFTLARDPAATDPFGLLVVQQTGDLTVNDLTLTGAYSKYGAIASIGHLTLNNSTITGNNGVVLGGGLFNVGVATLNNSSVISNTTLVPSPVPYFGGGGINNWVGTITLNHSVVSGNSSTTFAGGIQNTKYGTVIVNESSISDNTAGYAGGALFSYKGTGLTVTNSTISDNDAAGYGGALAGIHTPITVTNSTISNNQADSGGGFFLVDSMLTMTDSTVTGNTGTSSGGGIYTDYAMQLTGNLIAGNNSPDGAEIVDSSGSPTLARRALPKSVNSLTKQVSDRLAKNPFLVRVRALVEARKAAQSQAQSARSAAIQTANTPTSANLLGHSGLTTSAAFDGFTPNAGDIVATSDGTLPTALAAILNPTLADNGGPKAGVADDPILTHALVHSSPAIDAAGDSGLATDQRGVTRPQGAADDIGAFEAEAEKINPDLALQGSPTTSFNATPDATFGAQSAAGVYTISATFRNTANPAVELHNVYFVVKQLVSINSVNNYLLSADNPPGQVGATQSVPNSAFGGDNIWVQDQDLPATFRIGLMERRRFTFLVDVYGVVANVEPGSLNPGATNGPQMLGHFSFTVDPNQADGQTQLSFLPLVNK